MPSPEPSQPPENRIDPTHDDYVQASVGEQAKNVVVGKNIIQIIIDKLQLPRWLVYLLTASLVIAASFPLWFVVQAFRGGIPVAVQLLSMSTPPPTTRLTLQPLSTPIPPRCPANQPCILIADFDPANDELAKEITRKIRAALTNAKLRSPTTFVVVPVGMITDAASAQQLASEAGALVIVWGQIFHPFKELSIHFELTDQFGVGESHALRPYRVHFFDTITQQVVCKEACFTDLSVVREVLDQLSTVIAYTAAGMLHYASEQPEAAEQELLAALYCSGETVDLLAFPDLAASCGSPQSIVGFNPAPIYYYAGKAQLLTGDYWAAIRLLEKAVVQNSQDPAALIGIATAYRSWLDRTDVLTATQALDEARARTNGLRAEIVSLPELRHDLAAVDYELGFIAELAGDWATAQAKYRDAVDGFGYGDPAAYVTLIALGRIQQMTKQSEAATQAFQAALALDEHAPWAWLELAQVYHNDRTKAAQQLAQAHQVAPNEAYVDIVEAELCAGWEDYACARAAYTRALEKRPRSGWLYGRVGDFYRPSELPLPHQSWAQAAEYYQQATQLRSDDPWSHERLAFAYFYLGRYAEAAEHFGISLNELSHSKTRTPERYCTLGQAQQAAKLLTEAVASYRTCLNGMADSEQQILVEGWIAEIEAALLKKTP